jgi:hypothetical protein
VVSKRLFWRTSQSSSTVAARLSRTGREAAALGHEFVGGEHVKARLFDECGLSIRASN